MNIFILTSIVIISQLGITCLYLVFDDVKYKFTKEWKEYNKKINNL